MSSRPPSLPIPTIASVAAALDGADGRFQTDLGDRGELGHDLLDRRPAQVARGDAVAGPATEAAEAVAVAQGGDVGGRLVGQLLLRPRIGFGQRLAPRLGGATKKSAAAVEKPSSRSSGPLMSSRASKSARSATPRSSIRERATLRLRGICGLGVAGHDVDRMRTSRRPALRDGCVKTGN